VSAPGRPAAAQTVSRGYDQVAKVYATGEERNRQRDLWVLEVHMKPMRLIWADITDPVSGEKKREAIWYLVYKAVNRPISGQTDTTDTEPVNTLDPVPERPKIIPEFTLVTFDDPKFEIPAQIHLDSITPEVVAAINKVERRRSGDPLLKESVSVVRDLPDASGNDAAAEWIHGVAVWRNVDPETDFFKVIFGGFSNGYEVKPGPDGEPVTWRKVLVQKFTRRGDRFDPNQLEFKFEGPPQWIYQPDAGTGAASPGPM
jgi:hypothetical protein